MAQREKSEDPTDRLCQQEVQREYFLLSLDKWSGKVCTKQASGMGSRNHILFIQSSKLK